MHRNSINMDMLALMHIIQNQIQIKQNEYFSKEFWLTHSKSQPNTIWMILFFHIFKYQIRLDPPPHIKMSGLYSNNILYQDWTKWVSTSRTVARDLLKGLYIKHKETKRRIHHCCRTDCCFTHLKMHLEKNEKYFSKRKDWGLGSRLAQGGASLPVFIDPVQLRPRLCHPSNVPPGRPSWGQVPPSTVVIFQLAGWWNISRWPIQRS